jgi:hypothetical protein
LLQTPAEKAAFERREPRLEGFATISENFPVRESFIVAICIGYQGPQDVDSGFRVQYGLVRPIEVVEVAD